MSGLPCGPTDAGDDRHRWAWLAEAVGPRWVQVDADALGHNVRQVLALLGEGTALMAVVKADAYGLGAVETARIALACGASWLGVTTVAEGLELRRHGIEAPVLVLAPPLVEEASLVVRHGLTATVTGREVAEALACAARSVGRRARVHLKVDTGLGRVGLQPAKAVCLAQELASSPELDVEGLFTHLADGSRHGAARRQAEAFTWVLGELERADVRLRYRHVCNSAATVSHPELHYDLVRVGNLLYGQAPEGEGRRLDLRDPWCVKARILQVRQVPAGVRVGYRGDFRTRRASVLAVIPLGVADGLGVIPARTPRRAAELARAVARLVLGGLGWTGAPDAVEVRGRRVPLVGRIAMQLCVADVTDLPGVAAGEPVAAPGMRRTSTSARLPRVYVREGLPYRVRTLSGEFDVKDLWAGDVRELRHGS